MIQNNDLIECLGTGVGREKLRSYIYATDISLKQTFIMLILLAIDIVFMIMGFNNMTVLLSTIVVASFICFRIGYSQNLYVGHTNKYLIFAKPAINNKIPRKYEKIDINEISDIVIINKKDRYEVRFVHNNELKEYVFYVNSFNRNLNKQEENINTYLKFIENIK